jgi:GAF domain-containing protein/anti-sigma regulatory factor (Ser/Thr protein kinase)
MHDDAPAPARADQSERIAQLERELAGQTQERVEAQAYQQAIADVLAVISAAPHDLQRVLDTIVATAAKLCEADTAGIRRRIDDAFVTTALYGYTAEEQVSLREQGATNMPATMRRTIASRATVHSPDIMAEDEFNDTASWPAAAQKLGIRSSLCVPFLSGGEIIGTLLLMRRTLRAFTGRQIELVETFARQAVIAMENARLFEAEQTRTNELSESLEYQTAIGNVLQVISRSPNELQQVLDTIVRSAAELCASDFAMIRRRVDGGYVVSATHGMAIEQRRHFESYTTTADRGSVFGRAILDGKTVHVPDIAADPELNRPRAVEFNRTVLGVPLMRDGAPIGVLSVMRKDPCAFKQKQIDLVTLFADQAVIAINNARLFEAEQTRTRELGESLKQQTATADVLKVISRSAFDLQKVLDTLIEAATQLCGAEMGVLRRRDGDAYPLAATYNVKPAWRDAISKHPNQPGRSSVASRAMLTRRTAQSPDVLEDADYQLSASQKLIGFRALLATPLMLKGEPIGTIGFYRLTPGAFTGQQIAMIETFADQAVIAMENARLFEAEQTRSKELRESLDFQTATTDVLGVISRSKFDLAPVLQSVVDTAVRLCRADQAIVYRLSDGAYRFAAGGGHDTTFIDHWRTAALVPGEETVVGRAALRKQAVSIPDALADPLYGFKNQVKASNARSLLGVPLMRDGLVIGVISLWRAEVDPFSQREIELVQTFADQAVIAISNTELFEQVEARTKEVTEALEYQTATAEVLAVISKSPTDVQPILDAIVRSAVRLCDGLYSVVMRYDGELLHIGASHNFTQEALDAAQRMYPMRPDRTHVSGRVVLTQAVVQIVDLLDDPEYAQPLARAGGWRAMLGVPMLNEGKLIGMIGVSRAEPGPFSERQVNLLKTFADQAVIAINNVGNFEQVQARTKEVSESLEYQTATSEVLSVISRSPTDLQPVLDSIVATTARLVQADLVSLRRRDGEIYPVSALWGYSDAEAAFVRQGASVHMADTIRRAITSKKTQHDPDILADDTTQSRHEAAWPGAQQKVGVRSSLAVPLLRDGELMGAMLIGRRKPRAFTVKQIALVETFADQAVIAISNTELFEQVQVRTKEVTEALEYQTATSEVLGVISKSPQDLQPVLDAIVTTAVRLCGSHRGGVMLLRNGAFHLAASANLDGEMTGHLGTNPIEPGRNTVTGRVALDGRTVHIEDTSQDIDFNYFKDGQGGVARSLLGVPLLRNGNVIGVLMVSHVTVKPFSVRQIELLETFANQAVIAINNVGLFEEVQARTKEVTEALEYQTATSEVLAVISKSPNETQPVFDEIVTTAARLCRADTASIWHLIDGRPTVMAITGMPADRQEALRNKIFPISRGTGFGRAILDKRTAEIADAQADAEMIESADGLKKDGLHSMINVPLMHRGEAVGAISLARKRVNPFSGREINVVSTFAEQAVIAIQNARLFEEVQARTKEVTEALEYQTATSEVLGVISKSPNKLQPVLDSIVETADRLCKADNSIIYLFEGDALVPASFTNNDPDRIAWLRAHPTYIRGRTLEPSNLTAGTLAIRDLTTIHVADMRTDQRFASLKHTRTGRHRAAISVPLMHDGAAIGVLGIYRRQSEAFTQRQVELATTFANQAVIAINNVGNFEQVQARTKEVTEALEYQTATSEVLSVISRSPNELTPVLQSIARTARTLCNSAFANIFLKAGDGFKCVLQDNQNEGNASSVIDGATLMLDRNSISGRVAIEGKVVHVPDVREDPELSYFRDRGVEPRRTALGVPLLRNGEVVGVINLGRFVKEPFTERQIAVVTTFADQAVIAMNNARLFEEVQARTKEVTEALEYQTATSGVLSVISKSPSQVEPVLDAIIETACQLCNAEYGLISRQGADGLYHAAANHNVSAEFLTWVRDNPVKPGDGSAMGIVAAEKKTLHLPDALADPRFSDLRRQRHSKARTMLTVPLLSAGQVIGVIWLAHTVVRPFTPRQIDLVTTFADQAVIAVNNAQLFNEVQARTKDVTEALEYQTATTAVLAAIAGSATATQPVFDAIVTNAARLCGAEFSNIALFDGELMHMAALNNMTEAVMAQFRSRYPMRPDRTQIAGRTVLSRAIVQVPDVRNDPDYPPEMAKAGGWRSMLGVPLISKGKSIGAIVMAKSAVGPYTDRQIQLVETFADQAVIAINNVRLFEEVQTRTAEVTEALEYQTATSDVLGVISRSPNELQPVLDAIVNTADRLCKANNSIIYLFEGDALVPVAFTNNYPERIAWLRANPTYVRNRPIDPLLLTPATLVIRDLETIHIADVRTDERFASLENTKTGRHRATICVPLMRDGAAIGVLGLYRRVPEAFTQRQVELATTFANQAVIAINNVGNFEQVQARTKEVTEALEYQTATSEVLDVISRSPNDVQPVLDAIARTAQAICKSNTGVIWLLREGAFTLGARGEYDAEIAAFMADNPPHADRRTMAGRAIQDRQTQEVVDGLADPTVAPNPIQKLTASRSMIFVPLLRNGEPLGVITLTRREVKPFTKREIALVETFADQAVIAINNARLFNEIQEKSRQLQVASQHKSQFLANMSHELRTPLNAIIGYTELIQDGIYGEPTPKIKGVVERVTSNGKHLLSLINDVLDFSKIEAGELKLQITDYAVKHLVQTVAAATEPLASAKKLTFTLAVDNNLPTGRADERRLAQVLLNLVGNAIKFTETGGITIAAAAEGPNFHLRVVDTGPGIAAEEHARIFEQFQQIDSTSTRTKGGTGLGLAITKKFVELHGGQIWVESEVGRGSTFHVILPVECRETTGAA